MIGKSTAIFAFGLVAFGFLGMGPVTIAVDSYGPVTDNAQSVYELSLIEEQSGRRRRTASAVMASPPDFEHAKAPAGRERRRGQHLQGHGQARADRHRRRRRDDADLLDHHAADRQPDERESIDKLSILHAPFLLGIIAGHGGHLLVQRRQHAGGHHRRVPRRRVHQAKHQARKAQTKASTEDSKKVVAICTRYAQAGMFNIFLTVFFITLAAAFANEYLFIGYLIGIAFSGLFQAVFMANAGGAWDNAKKIVETELHAKGTALHEATVVGDTVGDPFKDTSSVAMNPIIKFATLFGLLAVELAITLKNPDGSPTALRYVLAAAFFLVAAFFVYRSFYGMRIVESRSEERGDAHPPVAKVPQMAGK